MKIGQNIMDIPNHKIIDTLLVLFTYFYLFSSLLLLIIYQLMLNLTQGKKVF